MNGGRIQRLPRKFPVRFNGVRGSDVTVGPTEHPSESTPFFRVSDCQHTTVLGSGLSGRSDIAGIASTHNRFDLTSDHDEWPEADPAVGVSKPIGSLLF
jgi:hypothetical protein